MHNLACRRHTRTVSLASIALVAVLGLGACGSQSSTASGAAAVAGTAPAPEAVKVDPAVVTAGLRRLPNTIASAIAAIGTPDARAKLAEIEMEWFSFEGRVRDTDTALYLDIEDQLTPLQRQIEAGDSPTATATAAKLQGIFAQYMAKYS